MIILLIVTGIILFALTLTLLRVYLGPTLPDRVVGLDLLVYIVMSFLCIYALITKQQELLDAALILAIISFIGTVAYPFYFESLKKEAQNNVLD